MFERMIVHNLIVIRSIVHEELLYAAWENQRF